MLMKRHTSVGSSIAPPSGIEALSWHILHLWCTAAVLQAPFVFFFFLSSSVCKYVILLLETSLVVSEVDSLMHPQLGTWGFSETG